MIKYILVYFVLQIIINIQVCSAHCDTMDGPVVAAAINSIKQHNINYALIWVKPGYEKELKNGFDLTML